MASCRRTLVFPSPGRVEVREEPCPAPPPDEVLVEATVSAISAGTEMLVYRGHLPPGMPVDATIRGLGGAPSYPMKYGYASVGRVVDVGREVAGDWQGRLVFSLHPHESHYVAPTVELMPVPAGLDAAVAAAGFRGRVVIGSWYGDRPVEVSLGGTFHRTRMALISSQVSTIDPQWSGRWTRERRSAVAWRLLRDVDVEPLVTHRFSFADAAAAYELV